MKGRILIASSAVALLVYAPPTWAAERSAKLKKETELLSSSESARNSYLNAAIASGRPIETKGGAQAELRFADGVLVRLGQNSQFAVKKETGRMHLLRGAMLVRAPKSAGQTQVIMGDVISSVGGTTSLLEYYPQAYTKLISIDGTARMFMPEVIGESVLVNAGQLLMFHTKPAPKALPSPVDIDIKRLLATSHLIKGLPPLGSEPSIAQGMRSQRRQKSEGALADTNLVIFGRGTLVSLVPPQPGSSPSASPAASAKAANSASQKP